MMRNLLRAKGIASLGITVMLGALVVPAAAIQPVKFSQSMTVPSEIDCPGGVVLTGSATIEVHGTLFFDGARNTTRVFLHSHTDQVIMGPNGKTASGGNTQNETITFTPGGSVVRGVTLNLRVPGVGIVAHTVGRMVVNFDGNVISATPKLAHSDIPKVCAALE